MLKKRLLKPVSAHNTESIPYLYTKINESSQFCLRNMKQGSGGRDQGCSPFLGGVRHSLNAKRAEKWPAVGDLQAIFLKMKIEIG